MNRFLRAAFAVWLFTMAALGADAPKELRVLFIGNSLTSVNNLPEMIAGMAESTGRELIIGRQLVGGATLEKHWKEGKALARIKEGPWDYVVLQGMSTETYTNRDGFLQNGRLFDAEIKKAGAKPILYMTWALENAPEKSAAIEEAYLALGREMHATIVPAGIAWRSLTGAGAKSGIVLYNPDHKHPTATGTYLTACVFYRTLFGRPSLGLPGTIERAGKALATLSKENAELLQKAADAVPIQPTAAP